MIHLNKVRHMRGNKKAFHLILILPCEYIAKWIAEMSALPTAPGSGASREEAMAVPDWSPLFLELLMWVGIVPLLQRCTSSVGLCQFIMQVTC